MDEMWSFYHDKSHQIWLWWAIDHAANTPLAFTFGTREHKNLDDLLALLQPFPIRRVYTDNNFAYHKRIPAEQHTTGKRNTQKIERDHLTLRTRIKRLCRKTICFSKSLSANKQQWYNSHRRRWKKWRKRATSHGQYQMRSGRP